MRFLAKALILMILAAAVPALTTAEPQTAEAQADVDKRRIDALEKRIVALERRIQQLERTSAQQRPAGPSQETQTEAAKLLQDIYQEIGEMDHEAARASLAKLEDEKYSGTSAQRSVSRIKQELAVMGKPAPASLDGMDWIQGQDQINWSSPGAKLVVFWEIWCPHCRREVPKVEQTWKKYRPKGLDVIGLTKLSRDKTKEEVQKFIDENSLSYPMAKENGQFSRQFNVSGIPAAALVKDGEIVWRGHPARLSDAMIESLL